MKLMVEDAKFPIKMIIFIFNETYLPQKNEAILYAQDGAIQ